jgi:hypothetical protein
MRQIRVCAWFLLALTACGGEEFSSGSSPSAALAGRGGSTVGGMSGPGASPNGNSGSSGDFAAGGVSLGVGGSSGGQVSTGAAAPGAAGDGGDSSPPSGAGGASEDCSSGTITFRMLPGSKLTPDFLCDAGCGTGWLSITDADGAAAFSIFPACGTASCDSCEVQECAAAACLATPLNAQGSELVWRGTYLEKDKCGATSMVCQQQACVKPGKYKARACAALNAGANSMGGGCMPKDEQLCAEAEFEFPATKTVRLVLGE